jgi:F0F1-type ATP synthase membrane subunit b/b'
MTDPNWFYSALAQSAAAIVGLIGAFVTSRVMMMAGERSRREKRIDEINAEIKELERQIDEINAEIKELERQNVPLLEYINEVNRKIEEEDRKEDEGRVNDFLRAKKPELDLENLPTADEMLKELREGNRINIFDEKFNSMFKEKYNVLKEEISVEKEEAAQPKRISSLGGLLAGIQSPAPDPLFKKYRGIKEENDKKISDKNAIIQELQGQLKQMILPKHFKWFIISIIYFTVGGVILPLLLLPITPEQHLVWKPRVVFLFVTGLIAVFLYIFIEIKYITKKINPA